MSGPATFVALLISANYCHVGRPSEVDGKCFDRSAPAFVTMEILRGEDCKGHDCKFQSLARIVINGKVLAEIPVTDQNAARALFEALAGAEVAE